MTAKARRHVASLLLHCSFFAEKKLLFNSTPTSRFTLYRPFSSISFSIPRFFVAPRAILFSFLHFLSREKLNAKTESPIHSLSLSLSLSLFLVLPVPSAPLHLRSSIFPARLSFSVSSVSESLARPPTAVLNPRRGQDAPPCSKRILSR